MFCSGVYLLDELFFGISMAGSVLGLVGTKEQLMTVQIVESSSLFSTFTPKALPYA